MMSLPLTTSTLSPADLRATAQWMTLEPGLYTVRVTGGASGPDAAGLPFVQFTEAPGNPAGATVVMLGATPSGGVSGGGAPAQGTLAQGTLAQVGDALAIQVGGAAVRLVFTSYTAATQAATQAVAQAATHTGGLAGGLAVEISRLGGGGAAGGLTALSGPRPGRPILHPLAQRVLPLEVMAHVQQRGDLRFADGGWAGCPGQRQWIEAFALAPLEGLSAADLDYKAVTAAGWETPWTEGGALCGTRGLGVPLIGFAVRLRGGAADTHEVMYEGQFFSGARVGPVPGGSLCRSDAVADPLDGLLIRIVTKPAAGAGW